ncbi:cleavage stimulation factor subunit 2 [Holotrichia oblita]|uniref:Cleavage stimulation factor subunit 2 n=1 Tax=Holotrichia oblita TaxID=644536 RepID=A0ACB9SXV4_HOLOL|nr:cleavage stimulation factor subunit 2 [Holotrichia oblita]
MEKAEVQARERVQEAPAPTTLQATFATANKIVEKKKTHPTENVWMKDRAGRRKQAQEEKKAAAKADSKQQQKTVSGQSKDDGTDRKKQNKNKHKNRNTKPRLDALLVKPAQGKSYAEVLRELRSNAKPEETGTEIKAVRKTRAGDMLLELGPSTKDTAGFSSALKKILVGNIPYEATEEKLKDIFGEVGQVLSFKLVFDRETGKPKGYGFCEYRDQETALSAMRNLNGYEIGGRNLRVDNACTEKSRMEMQNLLNQPPVENPYGEPIQAEKAPEAISKAVASLPPEQMFELMKQMKLCIQNNPTEARNMLLQNPQLAYALLQAQVVMKIVDPQTACSMLHPQTPTPTPIMANDKPIIGQVPINNNFSPMATTVQPQPRAEFQPATPPVLHSNSQSNPVFSVAPGQDVDLRSLDIRNTDPRMTRTIGDQDMRTLTGQLPNPLPPVGEAYRDPRSNYTNDPRQQPRSDPRQKPIGMYFLANLDVSYIILYGFLVPAAQNVAALAVRPQPVPAPVGVPPPQPPFRGTVGMSPNIGPSGASDQEKAALIMQVLQLSDEQIGLLPPEQRNSILVLKEQIAKSTQR